MFSKRFPQLEISPQNQNLCGTRPNCVCSLCAESDTEHWIESLQIESLKRLGPNPIESIAEVVSELDRTKIVQQTDDYLLVEFRSRLGFVDDVEFVLASDVVHIRSASRIGYGDHGVNRKRIESLRQSLQNASTNE